MYKTWAFLWNTIQVIIVNVIGYSDTMERSSGLSKKKKKKACKLYKIKSTLTLDLKSSFKRKYIFTILKFHILVNFIWS